MKYQRTPPVRPNSLLVWQGESDSGEGPRTERENQDLVAEGFEPSGEEDDLWSKDGVWFGRRAALQKALRKPREEDGVHLFDPT